MTRDPHWCSGCWDVCPGRDGAGFCLRSGGPRWREQEIEGMRQAIALGTAAVGAESYLREYLGQHPEAETEETKPVPERLKDQPQNAAPADADNTNEGLTTSTIGGCVMAAPIVSHAGPVGYPSGFEANLSAPPPALSYPAFIQSKTQFTGSGGFAPLWLPECLFDFQAHLSDWMIRRGRAATFADCGLGKTLMLLVWAENVVRHTNGRVLILTPLTVSHQTVTEGAKFGVEVYQSRDGKWPAGARIVVTNYEKLHLFNAADFVGVVCDESGCLKNFDGVRKAAVTEFLRTLPYRLLCTATAAPNDYVELGTHSEALGELGYMDMLSRFFKANKGSLHPFHNGHSRRIRGEKWRFRGHAARDFWRWVCSWARACRKPSDLGFADGLFVLPPLNVVEHIIEARTVAPGRLFNTLARDRQEVLEDRRRTLPERCEAAAALIVATGEPAVSWCHLNDEGDLLTKLIPGAVQVSGKDPDERKEEVIRAFTTGEVRVVVTKPAIFGWGLNLQHCAHLTYFPTDSFEAYYQSVRRFWRFGQQHPVTVDVVSSDGAAGVLDNLQRKARQGEEMFGRLVALMNNELRIEKQNLFGKEARLPSWL